MEPLHKLLIAMASEQSGISSYWKERIQEHLNAVPQEPKNWAEVVIEEPGATLADVVISEV